jgi:hypothetical protein
MNCTHRTRGSRRAWLPIVSALLDCYHAPDFHRGAAQGFPLGGGTRALARCSGNLTVLQGRVAPLGVSFSEPLAHRLICLSSAGSLA